MALFSVDKGKCISGCRETCKMQQRKSAAYVWFVWVYFPSMKRQELITGCCYRKFSCLCTDASQNWRLLTSGPVGNEFFPASFSSPLSTKDYRSVVFILWFLLQLQTLVQSAKNPTKDLITKAKYFAAAEGGRGAFSRCIGWHIPGGRVLTLVLLSWWGWVARFMPL